MANYLVAEIEVADTIDTVSWRDHILLYRDKNDEVWGSTPAALVHFEVSGPRLSILAHRAGFPTSARAIENGRAVWNMSAIERWLISGRGQAGPMPRYVLNLMAAGKIKRPGRGKRAA